MPVEEEENRKVIKNGIGFNKRALNTKMGQVNNVCAQDYDNTHDLPKIFTMCKDFTKSCAPTSCGK